MAKLVNSLYDLVADEGGEVGHIYSLREGAHNTFFLVIGQR